MSMGSPAAPSPPAPAGAITDIAASFSCSRIALPQVR